MKLRCICRVCVSCLRNHCNRFLLPAFYFFLFFFTTVLARSQLTENFRDLLGELRHERNAVRRFSINSSFHMVFGTANLIDYSECAASKTILTSLPTSVFSFFASKSRNFARNEDRKPRSGLRSLEHYTCNWLRLAASWLTNRFMEQKQPR